LNEIPNDAALRAAETERSGGQKGPPSLKLRTGKKGVWEKEFLPALAFRFRFFRRRRISYFALRNAPPKEKMLCLPRPPLRTQHIISPEYFD